MLVILKTEDEISDNGAGTRELHYSLFTVSFFLNKYEK